MRVQLGIQKAQNKEAQTVKETKVGLATVRLMQGDITTCAVDAIVNATGKVLVPHDADKTQPPEPQEAPVLEDDQKDVPLELESADDYKAEHVLNTPIIETTPTSGAHKIRRTMRSILDKAQSLKFKTLALPTLGAGVNRYPLERSAEIMLQELARSLEREDNHLERVIVVVENQKSYRVFEQALIQFEQENDEKS